MCLIGQCVTDYFNHDPIIFSGLGYSSTFGPLMEVQDFIN